MFQDLGRPLLPNGSLRSTPNGPGYRTNNRTIGDPSVPTKKIPYSATQCPTVQHSAATDSWAYPAYPLPHVAPKPHDPWIYHFRAVSNPTFPSMTTHHGLHQPARTPSAPDPFSYLASTVAPPDPHISAWATDPPRPTTPYGLVPSDMTIWSPAASLHTITHIGSGLLWITRNCLPHINILQWKVYPSTSATPCILQQHIKHLLSSCVGSGRPHHILNFLRTSLYGDRHSHLAMVRKMFTVHDYFHMFCIIDLDPSHPGNFMPPPRWKSWLIFSPLSNQPLPSGIPSMPAPRWLQQQLAASNASSGINPYWISECAP